MSPPLLEVAGLSFRYRRATEFALRDVSLVVEPGQVVLVAGPSGCGKSTLVKAINGLIPHAYTGEYSGEVRVEGRALVDMRLREIALRVGTVLQDPAKQIVGATVEAELAFGPENLGLPRDEIRERIRDVAQRASIEHLLGRETANLSGGERQLVAAAGILMMRPRLYVVDEPLANLDPATADGLLALLRRMADDGEAIVIVEHRVEDTLRLRPDAVLYLEDGATRFQGPVEGFLRIADPRRVKLPFDAVLAQALASRAVPSGSHVDGAVPVPGGPIPAAGQPGPGGSRPAALGEATVAPAPASDRAPLDGARPPRLEFRAVEAGYGERRVLRGVSAGLGARETVAILGPNGSGKSTLFKTAMNLLKPTAGDVIVDGVSNRERTVADLARVFGFVFQSPSQMLFARTVREELLFGPRNLGRDPSAFDRLADESLRRVGLLDLERVQERPPLTLSFGQHKRLSVAIALAIEPPTLVLDEPSAGQDHLTANAFMEEVRAIEGLESLYMVTHDVDLAMLHADRIILLRDGEIVGDGRPLDVATDTERWVGCNLRVTSLMEANRRWGDGRHFLDAQELARRVAEGTVAGGASGIG